MKVLLLALSVVACSLADSAPEGPQGALLVLPQGVYSPPSAARQESLEKVSERVEQRLAQEQGSQRGNYHVYLSDGRLQRVQYTAAPVRQQSNQQQSGSYSSSAAFQRQQQQPSSDSYSRVSYQGSGSQQYSEQQQQSGSYSSSAASQRQQQQPSSGSEPNPIVVHFGRLQQERAQQQLEQLRQQQEELRQQEQQVLQQLQQQKEFASNYVATIRFSDVAPIPAPIYSQSPAPLTRILRYAPLY